MNTRLVTYIRPKNDMGKDCVLFSVKSKTKKERFKKWLLTSNKKVFFLSIKCFLLIRKTLFKIEVRSQFLNLFFLVFDSTLIKTHLRKIWPNPHNQTSKEIFCIDKHSILSCLRVREVFKDLPRNEEKLLAATSFCIPTLFCWANHLSANLVNFYDCNLQ